MASISSSFSLDLTARSDENNPMEYQQLGKMMGSSTSQQKNQLVVATSTSTSSLRQRRQPAVAPPPTLLCLDTHAYETAVRPSTLVKYCSDAPITTQLKNSSSNRSSSTGTWVLVYGYQTSAEREQVLRRFSQHGRILQTRTNMIGASNSLALQYASRREADTALRHHGCCEGFFCGVHPLNDDDPMLMLQSEQQQQPTSGGKDSSNEQHKTVIANEETARDIFLRDDNETDSEPPRFRGICEELFRWLVSIE